jgi:acetoin utilization protein AcuB
MNVSDVMTANPVTISRNSTVHHALYVMQQNHCHHLPITSEEKHLVGLITAEDCHRILGWFYLNQHEAGEAGNERLLVRNVMTLAPIIVEPDAPAYEAARLMLIHHLTALPVMRAETLVGIVTTSDLLIAFIENSTSTQPPHPQTLKTFYHDVYRDVHNGTGITK